MTISVQGPIIQGYEGDPPINQELVQIGDTDSSENLGTALTNITARDDAQDSKITALQNHPGGLPTVLSHLSDDTTVSETTEGGINTNKIYFPTANRGKPLSLEFTTDSPYVKNVLTDGTDGLSVDVTGGFLAPSAITAFGDQVGLRSKLTVLDVGQQNNWRDVYEFTMQLASIAAGGPRYWFQMERRALANSEHNILGFERVGDNVFLIANVFNPSTPSQQGNYRFGVGTRTNANEPYHFRVGDRIRMVVEFEKPNPSASDSTQNLRLLVTAHRLDTDDSIMETIEFDDVSIIGANDPDTTNRGRIVGRIDTFSFDTYYIYGGEVSSNFITPITHHERFQWVDTITPRDFLTHQQLADRSREAVSDDHRLLGYYQGMLRDTYDINATLNLKGKRVSPVDHLNFAAATSGTIPDGSGSITVGVNMTNSAFTLTLPSRSSYSKGERIKIVRRAGETNLQNMTIQIPAGSSDRILDRTDTAVESITLGAGYGSTNDFVELEASVESTGDTNWLVTHLYQKTGVGLGDSIRQVHSQDINVSSVDLLVDSGYNLPGDHDADVRYQIKVDPPTGDAFQLDSFTRAQWDALSTLSNRTNNPRNRQSDRAVINQTISGTTYSIHKGSGDHVVFGASATGNYTVTITELSAGALDAIPHFKSTDATVNTLSDTDSIPAFVGSDNDRRRITVANAKTLFGGGGSSATGPISGELLGSFTPTSTITSSNTYNLTNSEKIDLSSLSAGDIVLAYGQLYSDGTSDNAVSGVGVVGAGFQGSTQFTIALATTNNERFALLDIIFAANNGTQSVQPINWNFRSSETISFYKLNGPQGDPGPAGGSFTQLGSDFNRSETSNSYVSTGISNPNSEAGIQENDEVYIEFFTAMGGSNTSLSASFKGRSESSILVANGGRIGKIEFNLNANPIGYSAFVINGSAGNLLSGSQRVRVYVKKNGFS